MPVEGRDLSSRQTQYEGKDLEIGQPINSEECSETADGVARESEGVKSCPREAMGRAAEVVAPSSSIRTDGGCPVAQVNDLSRSLTAFDPISTLVVVVEIGELAGERRCSRRRAPAVEETGAGCDGTITIDRAVAERGGACWPADQPDRAGL